jgi:hypothetical protein
VIFHGYVLALIPSSSARCASGALYRAAWGRSTYGQDHHRPDGRHWRGSWAMPYRYSFDSQKTLTMELIHEGLKKPGNP